MNSSLLEEVKQAQLAYQIFLEAVEQSQSDHKITKEEHQYLKELWQAVLTAKQKANQAVTLLADSPEKEMLVAKLQALKEVPLPAITSVQAVEGKVEKTSSKGLEDSPKSQNTHSLSSPKEEPATSTNRYSRTRRSLSSIDLHEEKREERSAFMPLGTPVRGMTRSRNGAVDTVTPEVTVSSTAPGSQPYVQQNGNITQIHVYEGEETTITVSATDNSGQISVLRLNESPLYGLQQQPLTGKGSKENPDYSWADFRKNLKSAQVYYIDENQKPHMITKGDFDPTT